MKITRDQFDNVNIEFDTNTITGKTRFEHGKIVSYKGICYIGILDQPGLIELRYMNGRIKETVSRKNLDDPSYFDETCQGMLETLPFQV